MPVPAASNPDANAMPKPGAGGASWLADMPSPSFDLDADELLQSNDDAGHMDDVDCDSGKGLAQAVGSTARKLFKPMAVRQAAAPLNDGSSIRVLPGDPGLKQRNGTSATELHTPRVAAARRDLYAAVNDQKAWNGNGSTISSHGTFHAPALCAYRHRAPARPSSLVDAAFFKHAEVSKFRPVGRRKVGSNKKKRQASQPEQATFRSPDKVTGQGPGKKDTGATSREWQDFSQMVEDMRNIDISSLQVVELPSNHWSAGETTPRKSISIPLNVVHKSKPSKPERGLQGAEAGLPDGWTELTSRTTGQKYYGNLITGESSWVRPMKPATRQNIANLPNARAAPSVSIPALQLQEDDSDPDIVEEVQVAPENQHNVQTIEPLQQPPANQPDRVDVHQHAVSSAPNPDVVLPLNIPNIDVGDSHLLEIRSLETQNMHSHHKASASGLWMLSMVHVALTLSYCLATCVLLALWGEWKQRFENERQCSDGTPPPLMEWAFIMSIALFILAVSAHVFLSRPESMRRAACGVVAALCVANLSCFILGNVLVFGFFPQAGCTSTWTLAHAEYATAVVLIVLMWVGYPLAFILVCCLRVTPRDSATNFPKLPPSREHSAMQNALVELNSLPQPRTSGEAPCRNTQRSLALYACGMDAKKPGIPFS